MLQFISIPKLELKNLFDEDLLLTNPTISIDNISKMICDFPAYNTFSTEKLFDFFALKYKKKQPYFWAIEISNQLILEEKHIDKYYQLWINESNSENSMNTYGSLLEVQYFLKHHAAKEIYAVIRDVHRKPIQI